MISTLIRLETEDAILLMFKFEFRNGDIATHIDLRKKSIRSWFPWSSSQQVWGKKGREAVPCNDKGKEQGGTQVLLTVELISTTGVGKN